MIRISDEVEIDSIKTEKKIVKKEEVEYLNFHFQGKMISLGVKDLIEDHPLLELRHTGLQVKAQIVIEITNPQKSIEDFK